MRCKVQIEGKILITRLIKSILFLCHSIVSKHQPTFFIDEELHRLSIGERNEGTKMNPPLQKTGGNLFKKAPMIRGNIIQGSKKGPIAS